MANQTGPVFRELQAQLGAQEIAGDLLNVYNDTVDHLLAEPTQSSRPGMLLGKIQSGKTKAFIGVLAIAFDNGFEHAVIFTKGTKALARQTVARLRKDLKLAIDKEFLTVDDIMMLPDTLSPWQLDRKLILVCKKEDDNLIRLTEVLTIVDPENWTSE
jgi:D-serine dehydratase